MHTDEKKLLPEPEQSFSRRLKKDYGLKDMQKEGRQRSQAL
jgi:hypothetical protein